jgi:hypothetical protein
MSRSGNEIDNPMSEPLKCSTSSGGQRASIGVNKSDSYVRMLRSICITATKCESLCIGSNGCRLV